MQQTSTKSIRILIVDDHPVMCSGLANMLGTQPDMTVVGAVGSGSEALQFLIRESVDLMLLDLRMPGMDGISVLRALQIAGKSSKVVVLTSYEQDEMIYQAIRSGAHSACRTRARLATMQNCRAFPRLPLPQKMLS